MNERRTLHPAYILIGVLSTLKVFWPLLLLVLFKNVKWLELHWYWFAAIGGGLVLLTLLCFLTWKRFGFWLEEDRIVIRTGLVFRDEKTIYYSRIHSVNVEQPLLQRMLGVAQIKIETPGGNKKADGILPTLSLKEANAIKQLLRVQSNGSMSSELDSKGGMGLADELSTAERKSLADGWPVEDAARHNLDNASGRANPILEEPAKSGMGTGRTSAAQATVRLDSMKLFQAAATSMNFGLAAAFIAGLISFADDFIDFLLPEQFFESVIEDTSSLMPDYLFVISVAVIVLIFAWLLSILLYIIKYSGFTIKHDGEQISLSYGLLEKKTFLFDPRKVQAVIVNEGLLRQPFGYAEVKLQVISSDKGEQLMLHPFVKRSEIEKLLELFVPQIQVPLAEGFAKAPRRALLYYVRIQLLLAAAACVTLISIFHVNGLWSLLLIPLVVWWRMSCHRTAGMKLENGQLTLQNRLVSKTTYYIRRRQILTMQVKRSRGQQRKQLLSLSVHAMGSPIAYRVSCLDQADIEPVWRWYSREN